MTVTTKPIKLKRHDSAVPTIVQILPELISGGVERGTIEMAEAIQSHGGRAVVISHGGAMTRYLQRMGAVHHQLDVHSKNPLRWPSIRRQVKAVLQAENADIVHVRSRAPAWIALPAAAALNVPTVSTVHGRFVSKSFLKRIYNRKLLATDHVIAISNYVRDLITSQYISVADRMSVIHRGVDTDLFNPAKVNQTRIVNFADKVALPEDVPVVMLPARATLWKGQKVLLEALAKIKDRPFICLLVGAADGKENFVNEVTRYGQDLGLEGRFRLTAVEDDMPAALMLADVVVMPSITPEPFGRVALEAQAMGRPIVAFNHGGAVVSIIHGQTGWLVTPGDVDQLATTLHEALSLSSRKRKQMASAARRHIETEFSTANMCDQTLRIYRRLLDKVAARRRAKAAPRIGQVVVLCS